MITENKKDSQCMRILNLLRSKEKVQLPELLKMWIANHTARMSNLRKKGYDIKCKKKWDEEAKEYHSEYKLITD